MARPHLGPFREEYGRRPPYHCRRLRRLAVDRRVRSRLVRRVRSAHYSRALVPDGPFSNSSRKLTSGQVFYMSAWRAERSSDDSSNAFQATVTVKEK